MDHLRLPCDYVLAASGRRLPGRPPSPAAQRQLPGGPRAGQPPLAESRPPPPPSLSNQEPAGASPPADLHLADWSALARAPPPYQPRPTRFALDRRCPPARRRWVAAVCCARQAMRQAMDLAGGRLPPPPALRANGRPSRLGPAAASAAAAQRGGGAPRRRGRLRVACAETAAPPPPAGIRCGCPQLLPQLYIQRRPLQVPGWRRSTGDVRARAPEG